MEGAAEKMCDELTKPQIPHSPVPLVREEIEKIRSEDGEERRGWGEDVVRFSFYFPLSYFDLIGNILS